MVSEAVSGFVSCFICACVNFVVSPNAYEFSHSEPPPRHQKHHQGTVNQVVESRFSILLKVFKYRFGHAELEFVFVPCANSFVRDSVSTHDLRTPPRCLWRWIDTTIDKSTGGVLHPLCWSTYIIQRDINCKLHKCYFTIIAHAIWLYWMSAHACSCNWLSAKLLTSNKATIFN